MALQAETTADYLEQVQWKKPEGQPSNIPTRRLNQYPPEYNAEPPTMEELWQAIKKLKRNKAPGPDQVTGEMIKMLNEENQHTILDIIQEIWETKEWDRADTNARVVSLYKKGDPDLQANYRPISLLNILYKIFASILRTRITEGIEKELWKTQYGFRANKSTANAVHIIRRIQDILERSGTPGMLCLLGWEKAFDKLNIDALILSLKRYGVHEHLQGLVQLIYQSPTFYVGVQGQKSSLKEQSRGIRQGCPLSPYLFVIAMSALMEDVHHELRDTAPAHRLPGINFDEVLYTDDTILLSTTTQGIHQMLWAIEKFSAQYGLALNYKKCELLEHNCNPRPKFRNGRKIPKVHNVTYLGCNLNAEVKAKPKIETRLRACTATWHRLGTLWKHSACTAGHKIRLWNAVIKSKLLYGLESVHMTPAVARRLATLQLRGLRQIPKIPTTFIDRTHTNNYVYDRANWAIQNTRNTGEGNQEVEGQDNGTRGQRAVLPISKQQERSRISLRGHLLRAGEKRSTQGMHIHGNGTAKPPPAKTGRETKTKLDSGDNEIGLADGTGHLGNPRRLPFRLDEPTDAKRLRGRGYNIRFLDTPVRAPPPSAPPSRRRARAR